MTEEEQTHFLEIYKLHAQLANEIGKRREFTNRLYGGFNIFLFVSLLKLFENSELLLFCCCCGLGVLFCLNWRYLIKSYKKLNKIKYHLLQDLEKKLSFDFFSKEAKREKKAKRTNFSNLEMFMPCCFLITYLLIVFLKVFEIFFNSL